MRIKIDTAQIRHETLRIAVIQQLETCLGIQPDGTVIDTKPDWDEDVDVDVEGELEAMADSAKAKFEPFKDLLKQRFLWYFDTYLQTIETHMKKHKPGEKFVKMPFENGNNSMDGSFQYPELKRRLLQIKEVIYKETETWAVDGWKYMQAGKAVAVNLQRQFEQLVENQTISGPFTVDMGLVDGNPFLWRITYFGRPMTHLDGGIFVIKVHLSPKFPDEQPRVRIETPIYHHRVSSDGVVCYFPTKQDESSMKMHVTAIISALEDEEPPFDPRTIVHPEATKLFWGSENDKKQYNRALRRSVQRSIEE